jgi:hypothetical protein
LDFHHYKDLEEDLVEMAAVEGMEEVLEETVEIQGIAEIHQEKEIVVQEDQMRDLDTEDQDQDQELEGMMQDQWVE